MRQLVYTSLLPIITLRFNCGELKICSSIKKAQNIMNIIVGDKKLSAEHTLLNSKRILQILKCSSLPLFLRPWIRNEKYVIPGNMEIRKMWKGSGYYMYHFMASTPNAIHVFYTKKYIYKKMILKSLKTLRKC